MSINVEGLVHAFSALGAGIAVCSGSGSRT